MENRVALNLLDETFADAFAYLPKKGEAHFLPKPTRIRGFHSSDTKHGRLGTSLVFFMRRL
jgi:hypothetical protein